MIKSCAKLDNGKMLILLGVVEANLEQILKDNPLIVNLGYAGSSYQTFWFCLHNNEATSIESIQKKLAESPIIGTCCAMGIGEAELEQLKDGLLKIDPAEAMPKIHEILVFYGENEKAIEKMFRNEGLVSQSTKVVEEGP